MKATRLPFPVCALFAVCATAAQAGTSLPVPTYGYRTYTSADLLFDDYWQTSTLNTTNWLAGVYVGWAGSLGPDEGNAHQCYPQPPGGLLASPNTSPPTTNLNVGQTGSGGNDTYPSCAYSFYYDYNYGQSTNGIGLSFNPLWLNSVGNLRLRIAANSHYTSYNAQAQFASGAITTTTNMAIQHQGGIIQFKMRGDANLTKGEWPAVQCSAINATTGNYGYDYNFNMEWGYTAGGNSPLVEGGLSYNNNTIGNFTLPTANDATNFHTYAMEYTGDGSTKEVIYYVDGAIVGTHTNTNATGLNYSCFFVNQLISPNGTWHSQPDNPPVGPMDMFINDVQVYKASP